jgi:hypothetical protein
VRAYWICECTGRSGVEGVWDKEAEGRGEGDERAGEMGVGDERAGEMGVGDERAGEMGVGDERAGEMGVGDERAGEMGVGDERAGEMGVGDERAGDEGRGETGKGVVVCTLSVVFCRPLSVAGWARLQAARIAAVSMMSTRIIKISFLNFNAHFLIAGLLLLIMESSQSNSKESRLPKAQG